MSWTAVQLQTAREICAIARKFRQAGMGVPDLLHLAVVMQESEMLPNSTGDNGQSFGPHQIYQTAHPGTDQLASSPWADYGFFIMAEQWKRAFDQLGGDAQWADVAGRPGFCERFAPAAQGSVPWPAGTGALRYAEAVELLELVS